MIIDALAHPITWDNAYLPFGDGRACQKIVSVLDSHAKGE